MKKLSDYQGEEAIELWADLIDLLMPIFTDKTIADSVKNSESKVTLAKRILKNHKEDAVKILLRIDPTPINGLNVVLRTVAILSEIGQHEELMDFFGFAGQAKTDNESSGLPMVNTEAEEK